GQHRVEVAADLINYVEELDETNNFLIIDLELTITEEEKDLYNYKVIKLADDPKVYNVVNGVLHWIPSKEIFLANGYNWGDIIIVPREVLGQYDLGDEVSYYNKLKDGTLIKLEGDIKIYSIDSGFKRYILSPEVFEARGYNWGDVITLSKGEFDSYPEGEGLNFKN
ncbi:MAG TPA: hypothetical protein VGA49_02385, partial [Patescibacteria group bacterium]